MSNSLINRSVSMNSIRITVRQVRELRKIVYLQKHVLVGLVIHKNTKVETVVNPPLDMVVELSEKDSLSVIGDP